MQKPFHGKTVFVTGASSGFGAAFAKIFAQEGACLVIAARRKDRLQELAQELQDLHQCSVTSLELDVSDAKAVETRLKNFNIPVDILINNAGLARSLDSVWQTSSEDIDKMIDTNVKGLLSVTRALLPAMIQADKGHIINISSMSGYDTYPGAGVYCATKFAVRAITDTLRKELVASNIRVSMISPGMAKTEFSNVRFSGDSRKAEDVYAGIDPLTAQDVAETALFIASRPAHVNVADVILYPTHQASVSIVHRKNS